ncbi:MAG: phenylalanine--tRNA ligase subunit beta [Williamsia sp.]|nr:phenylalanine--tRNA ligase subunit beta [Williamsia sp.]
MTISYNWISKYLPIPIAPPRLSEILTAIGLEVESMEDYESVRGGLKGLLVGEVKACEKHPNADKLTLTKVDTGTDRLLQIVCGAPNVAAGQKVVVAPVGTTIYPVTGEPITMKLAKIRGSESEGMICAEDEIGIGQSHAGIIVLPAGTPVGIPAADYFKPYKDVIYEIGLTPNRMDAMSHLGAARDVCAYLASHESPELRVKTPVADAFKADDQSLPISVTIENTQACQRYAGVSIKGISVAPSPAWLQDQLKAIGLRPINNVVDITNYILHDTGQPLHAFDADAIKDNQVIVKNLPEGTPFITLDGKERKLSAEDLMICNSEEGMCIGGVFGGLTSGVKDGTTNIFLESAWFNPADIRKTSFRHGLRTDAATRFEKGVDISNTVNVLKRAALMIREIAGGTIAMDIVDVYPQPKPKTEVTLTYPYLRKLSGNQYKPEEVRTVLEALEFEIVQEDAQQITVKVPYSKTDISLPADIVEEVLRIDGYDRVAIPSAITITPAVEKSRVADFKEKVAGYLTGAGFYEIMTNSITNSSFFPAEDKSLVKMINSLSAGLDVMRPSMLETGLQVVAYNLNRRQSDLLLYEFGKTYSTTGVNNYQESDHLCLYITGSHQPGSWKSKGVQADFYYLKGIAQKIFQLTGLPVPAFERADLRTLQPGVQALYQGNRVVTLGQVTNSMLEKFDIKQPVFFADFNWNALEGTVATDTRFTELPKQLPVQRDLAFVVSKALTYNKVEQAINNIRQAKLQRMELFDVFESDKLGTDKKSMAVSFIFLDPEKTMNDKEIDNMMGKIMAVLENELHAEIRK